jgi:hypothetical protein
MYLVESDGDWWFNPVTLAKVLKLDGLTETQENIKLYCGFTHCPSCKFDLTPLPNAAPGFFDYDVDSVRIQKQFACRKCRHQWGPEAGGARDSAVQPGSLARSSSSRSSIPHRSTAPATGSITGRVWEIADELYASQDWKSVRAAVMLAGEAAGIHPSTVATQVAKWRKARGVA